LNQPRRHDQVVEDVQHRDGDDRRDVEPERDVHVRSRRFFSVPKKLTAKTTQTTAIAMSIGHSSSAYSLPCVSPSGSVIAAETMIACQPQKWMRLSASLNIRALHSRCVE
jgi:hypothetical protein